MNEHEQIRSEETSDESATNREQLIKRLLHLFGGSMEYVNLWLDSPRPSLGGRTPNSYLQDGEIQAIESLVAAIEYGIPG